MSIRTLVFSSLVWLFGTAGACAGELDIQIVDRQGTGVSEVVVTVAPTDGRSALTTPATAVMDQHQLAFTPRVLVVAVGSQVEFPNNDTVSHQVYSFSTPKKFRLPLYKGEPHAPVTFDRAGLVVLGCNIHDNMVGYIYVTDAPYFGTTEGEGRLHLSNVPTADYRITVWSPFIEDSAASLIRTVHVAANMPQSERWQLTHALRARPEPRPARGDWEY